MINLEIVDGVAVVTLDNPTRRNALNPGLAHELVGACDAIDADPAVGAAVIRGSEGYFCAGGDRSDLAAIARDPWSESSLATVNLLYECVMRFGRLRVPTVAAVRGGAVGAGVNLALAADVCITGEAAVWSSGFTALGLHPGGGHLALVSGRAGRQVAVAFSVLGVRLSGADVARVGLAYEATQDAEVDRRALAVAAGAGLNPELARTTYASLGLETEPFPVGWAAAREIERVAQLRTFGRESVSDALARGNK